MNKIVTYENFLERSKEYRNPNVEIIGKYDGITKPILCKCKIDGYEWYTTPRKLELGHGCPVCVNKIVVPGINDLYTTNPEIIPLLENKNDGFKYTYGSNKKILFECPVCHKKKYAIINEVIKFGLKCPYCSDHVSFCEKVLMNILFDLNIDFTYQFTPTFANGKRYDFLIKSFNVIVELDGGVGHGNRMYKNSQISTIDSYLIDREKDKLAINNGYKIIRINTDYPTESQKNTFIIDNIINSELNKYINFKTLDFNLIIKKSSSSILVAVCNEYQNIKSIKVLSEKFKLSISTIINYLKRGRDIGLCDYYTKYELTDIPIRCINTNKVYKNSRMIQQKLGFESKIIRAVCDHKAKSCGKSENGEPLIWEYVYPN